MDQWSKEDEVRPLSNVAMSSGFESKSGLGLWY